MPKFYAVARGKETGIFTTWDKCKEVTQGYHRALFKSFEQLEEAQAWLKEFTSDIKTNVAELILRAYSDGSFVNGKAGAGVYIPAQMATNGEEYKFISKVEGKQTSARAELTAIYLALSKTKGTLCLYVDSEYAINTATKKWKAKANEDLLIPIWKLLEDRKICFIPINAHTCKDDTHSQGNEMADNLANKARLEC